MKLRGHKIEKLNGEWVYLDTKEPTVGNRRDCGHCGLPDTPEGHDGCLGTLPNAMNACCGHGEAREAYIQFNDGDIIEGHKAMFIQSQFKEVNNPS